MDFDEDDLSDLTAYLAAECGFNLSEDAIAKRWDKTIRQVNHELKDEGLEFEMLTPSYRIADPKLMEDLLEETRADFVFKLALSPFVVYTVLAMVQTSIKLVPEVGSANQVGKDFIQAFCDRYKADFPAMVKTLELGWKDAYQMTREEFDSYTDDEGVEWEAAPNAPHDYDY